MRRIQLPPTFSLHWRELKTADGGFYLAWRTITFLLVLLGFMALSSTGEVDPIVGATFFGFWSSAFFVFHRPDFWRDWMGKAAIWVTLAIITWVALHGHFSSVLDLMLFLAIYKCFTLREAIDHLHALIMSFFMFLACSVISSSVFYMAFMFCFIILMMLDMICLTIAREGARVYSGFGAAPAAGNGNGNGHGNGHTPAIPPFWRRLFASSFIVGSAILGMTLLLFLAMPHYSAYRIPNPFIKSLEEPTRAVSGFSDDVHFGSLKNLQLDDSEVMKVYPAWDDGQSRPYPAALRLRGQGLDQYNENSWTTFGRGSIHESARWELIKFERLPASQGPLLKQDIHQNKSLRRLFGASMPCQFKITRDWNLRRGFPLSGFGGFGQRPESAEPFRLRLEYNTQAVQIIPNSYWGYGNNPEFGYSVLSALVDDAMPFMRALIRAAQDDPSSPALTDPSRVTLANFPFRPIPNLHLAVDERRVNTYLPSSAVSHRLVEIANQHATARSTPEKINQLMNWFYADFDYSLNPDTPYGQHPIEAFLTRTHKGHCEYFASAFVLLLRAQGIPARLATGFFTSEMKDEEGRPHYVVRQSDAHAWAEVWLDGYGWLTFDPTPPDWRGRTTRMRENPSRMSKFSEQLKTIWQRYVLDYTGAQQQRLVAAIMNNRFGRAATVAVQSAVDTAKSMMLVKSDNHQLSNSEIQTRVTLLVVALALAMLLVFHFILRARRAARDSLLRSPVAFMNKFVQRLYTLGWKRIPSQTPAEWLTEIDLKTEGRWQLAWVLDVYHRCRFAQEALNPDEESRIRDILRQLRR